MELSEIRYRIADRLFSRELDEAFEMGIREGKRRQASEIRVRMDYKKTRRTSPGMTKTQALGWDKCMEEVQDVIK